jgi:hypothetical protein
MNQGEIEQRKTPTKWIVLVGAVIVIVVLAIISYSVLTSFVNRPNPEITMVDGHGGLQGLNYVHYVDVKVTNNGGEGWIRVYAEINGPRYEEQNQRIYMDEGDTEQLQFVFDVGILDSFSSVTSKAWAIPE